MNGGMKVNDRAIYKLCASIKTTPAAKLLYSYLLNLTNDNSTVIMSIRNLANGVGLSRNAIKNNLLRLERLELIRIIPRHGEDGGQLANKYIIR